jgi:hypothetical protein
MEDGLEHVIVPVHIPVRDHDPVIRTEHSHVPAPDFHPTPPPPEPPPAGPREHRKSPLKAPAHERTFTTGTVSGAG